MSTINPNVPGTNKNPWRRILSTAYTMGRAWCGDDLLHGERYFQSQYETIGMKEGDEAQPKRTLQGYDEEGIAEIESRDED